METKELIAKIDALTESAALHFPECTGSLTPKWATGMTATQFAEIMTHYGATYLSESSGKLQGLLFGTKGVSVWIDTPHKMPNRFDLNAELTRMVREEEQATIKFGC